MSVLLRSLVVFALFFTYGCSGGGSSSSEEPAADKPADNDVTLTTTLELAPGPQPAGGFAQSVRSAAVTAATVILTLPDGTTYEMTDNGSGGYSCTVSDFPTGSPFVIEAHAGDLVLKNFFDQLPETEDAVDLGVTDPDTTLFTDLVAAFAGALDANNNTPSADNLLDAIQGASLQIDFTTLKSQVEDENDPTFEQVRSTYRTVLSESNVSGGKSSAELIADAGTFETVVSEIDSGGVLPPTAGSDSESAKLLMADLYQAFFEGDLEALAAGLGGEGFLWEGMDQEAWLLNAQDEDDFGAVSEIAFTKAAELTTVEPGPESDSWWVYLGAEVNYVADGVERYFKVMDKKNFGEGSPLLVKKDAAGRFAVYGDQKKSYAGAQLEMVHWMNTREGGGTHTHIELGIETEETTQHPIQSVTLGSSVFGESFPVLHHPWEDSNERNLWITYKYDGVRSDNVSIYHPATDNWESQAISWTSSLSGASLDLNIAYADGTQETRRFRVPPVESVVSADIRAPVFNADGTITVQWTDISGNLPGGAGFSNLEVNVIDDSEGGWRDMLELWDLDSSISSVTIPAGTLESGKIYFLEVSYEDLYGRDFVTYRYFEMPEEVQAPMAFTTELLDAAPVFFVRYTDEDTGGTVQETISVSGAGGAYSVSVLFEEFDSNGGLIISETDQLNGVRLEADGTLKVVEADGTTTIITLLNLTESYLDVRGEVSDGDIWEDRWHFSRPAEWITVQQ